MATWLVSVGLVAAWLGQTEPERPAAASRAAIQQAVRELGDVRFSVRRRASLFLWQQGLAAEAALKEAAESTDREVRLRARRILEDFRYGILPDVPADVVGLIRQFRDGNVNERLFALQRLADRGRFDALERLIEREPVADVRRQLLVYLMRNPRAVDHFLETDRLERLIASVGADQQEAWRRNVLAQLLFSAPLVQKLAEKGRLDALMKVVQREKSAVVRRRMLSMLFQNQAAVAAVIEKDQLEFLLGLIAKEPDGQTRGTWISGMLASSAAVKHLVEEDRLEQVLKFARDHLDARQRSVVFQRLFQIPSLVEAVLAKRGIEGLVALTVTEKDPAARGRMAAALVSSSAIQQHVPPEARNEWTIKLARHEKDASARAEYLKAVLNSAAGYYLLRDAPSRKALWQLVKTDTGKTAWEWRGSAVYRILCSASADELLRGPGQAEWLLRFLREEPPPQNRAQIIERLLADSRLRTAVVGRDRFDTVLVLVKHLPSDQRGRLMAQLFSTADPFQTLADGKRLDLMMTLAKEEKDAQARSQYLQGLFQNEAVMAAVIEGGYFDDLWKLVRGEGDAGARRRLLAELLRTGRAIRQLAAAGTLRSTVQEVLAEPDQQARRQCLERWFTRSAAVDTLLDEGLFDTLYGAADADPDPAQRRRLLGYLLTRKTAIQCLADRGQIGVLIGVIAEEADESRSRYCLQTIVQNAGALKAVLAGGCFDNLLELINRQQDANSRHSLLASFLLSPATLDYLAENGQVDRLSEEIRRQDDPRLRRQFVQRLLYYDTHRRLLAEAKLGDELVAMLKADPNESQRQTAARTVLTSASLCSALVNSGQADVLYEIAKWEPDERQRRAGWCRILYSPSGLLPYHLRRGEDQEVKRLLEENAVDDLGRLRLATYLMAAGQLDPRIAEVRGRIEQGSTADDARLLTYLLRARGDLDGACEAARATDDPGLLKAVLVEARRWSEAAELQAAGPCPLPIPTRYRLAQNDAHRRVEQLGLVAAYQRLAGKMSDCQKTVDQVLALAAAKPDDADLCWFCVEALLVNGRVAEAMKLLAKTHPSRAFHLQTYRYQYREALALAGWPRDGSVDRAWLDSLPADAGDAARQPVARLQFALRVARALHMLGKREAALRIIDLLEAYADEQPDARSTSAPRRECWQHLCVALAELGYNDRAWQAGTRALLSPNSWPPMLSRLYPRRYGEARGWWTFFRRRRRLESPAETFERIHRVMKPARDEAPEAFTALAEEAIELAQSLSGSYRDYVLTAAAESCRRRGRIELVRRCSQQAGESNSAVAWALADLLRDAERWAEAADAYNAVWENDRGELAALYLAGDALQRAGQGDEGRRRKELATMMALDSQARLDMGVSLMRHGLPDEGIEQLRLVLRTAPFEHWEWNDAVRRLGDHTLDTDPAEAAGLLELSLLDDLRTYFYLLDSKDYLHTPSVIHRLRGRAAIEAGKFEEAEQQVRLALVASPGATSVAEELVPLLEQAGRRAQADKLFDEVHRLYSEWLATYPDCGLLHNNLAWLSARCDRHLDEALQHAERAVELVPNHASYLDTLAECHFRLGDRDTAIRYSRRAVELRPESETLQRQLDRFQNAPLPARSE